MFSDLEYEYAEKDLKFDLIHLNEIKMIRTKDLVWNVESQIDESFALIIYPKSKNLLSCNMSIDVSISQVNLTDTLNFKTLICQFDQSNFRHKLNLGFVDTWKSDNTYRVEKMNGYIIQLKLEMKISDIQRKSPVQ